MSAPHDPDITPREQDTDLLELTQQMAGQLEYGTAFAIPPGTRIGRYRVVRTLGRGGMGLAMLAEQTEPIRRPVAIKLVAHSGGDRASHARFEIERQALARMAHPGIAQIYDAGSTAEGAAWFAMEYVDGLPLDGWWRERRPDPVVGIGLLRDVCRAVGHAHRRGVIHCDLKPANVLVAVIDGQPRPKVIDFGIARAIGQHESGHAGGTPDYISPEQADGVSDLDARSDVHALAAMLRGLLSGQALRPWLADCKDSPGAVFRRIASERVRTDHDAAIAELPMRASRRRELAAILARALAHDPAERYEDAHAFADELDRWLQRRPVRAMPPSRIYRWRCALRRHRVAAAVAVAFALLSAAFSWQLAAQYRQTLIERDTAEQMVEILLDTYTAADPIEYPSGSISARQLLAGAAERIARHELPVTTRARVLLALGNVQQNLELYEDARRTLLAALATGDRSHLDSIELLLARVDHDAGEFGSARVRAEAVAERHAGRGDGPRLQALIQLADTRLLEGDTQAARSLLEEVRGAALTDPASETALQWHLQWARVADEQGDQHEALAHYRSAHVTSEALWGGADLRTLNVLNDLAIATGRAGNNDEAIALLTRIAHSTQAAWGRSAGLAIVYGNLGTASVRAGNAAEAEHWHRQAIAIFEEKLGQASMHTGTEYNNLAAAIEAQGRPAEALQWFDKAEHSLARALGPDHLRVGIVLHNHARALLALSRTDEARDLLERSAAILEPALGQAHPRWQVYQVTLAEAHLQQGQASSAVPSLQAALSILEQAMGPHSREAMRARRLLLVAQALIGDCSRAGQTLAALPEGPERVQAGQQLAQSCP